MMRGMPPKSVSVGWPSVLLSLWRGCQHVIRCARSKFGVSRKRNLPVGAGPSIALEFARDWTTPTLARHSMPLGQVGFSFFFELNILRMKQRTRSRGLDLQSFAYPYLLQVP
jgi:hypothetical protein